MLFDQLNANIQPGPGYEPDALHASTPPQLPVSLIAFYLPQFHRIPENDAWWGKGFTEWTNVTKALPRYVGHIQPRLPGELGFYDLRNGDVLRRQAQLARRYGIHGFCFHHYWFNGRRLLQSPLELLLANADIDLPFCVNWANENWTRRWDGLEEEVLIAQSHSPEDDVAFARSLVPVIRDPRYIHVGDRPLVMIYRPGLLPDPVATVRRWRTEFMSAGVGNPYIIMAQAFADEDPRLHGIDAAVEFPPHKLVHLSPSINTSLKLLDPRFTGHVIDYQDLVQRAVSLAPPPYKLFRGICPNWDNEPRKPGRGISMAHSTPVKYGEWLAWACRWAISNAGHRDEFIVFVNAWNEWAEGAYLEPDRHFGYAYLAETARVLSEVASPAPATQKRPTPSIALISHDAHLHGAQLIALAIARTLVRDHGVRLTVLLGGPGELERDFRALARTETVPGNFADAAAWRDAAHRLAGSRVTAVLCNTLVAAQAIGPLRDAGLRVIQLVHELPSLAKQYGLETAAHSAAQHAAAIVFPSTYVRDRFVEVAARSPAAQFCDTKECTCLNCPATRRCTTGSNWYGASGH